MIKFIRTEGFCFFGQLRTAGYRSFLLLMSLLALLMFFPATAMSGQSEAVPAASDSSRLAAARIPLQSAAGTISLESLKGKVVVMFFGYTHCPDVCPRDMDIVAQALNGLDAAGLQRTQGLFVSLDPARDDVDTLKKFTRYFHANLLGVTADAKTIQQFSSGFGIHYKQVPAAGSAGGYTIEHTASIYVLDGQGRLGYIMPNGISSTALQQAVQFLLSEIL